MPQVGARHLVSALFKGVLLVLLLALVASCARAPQTVLGDNAPHNGVRRAHSLPVQGIDVARYQGNIDWHAVRRSGIRFAFIKATEGGNYLDPDFRRNWEGARAAGVARSAYHFMTWCRPAEDQAAWFIQNVPADPSALPPVLDLEWNNHSSCRPSLSRDEVIAKINVMLTAMYQHTGKLPIIYTDINFHRDILEGLHVEATFWLRSVAAEPHERYNGRMWTFWQWSQTGTVPGIRGEVDRNAWYGSESEWVRFLLTGCDPRSIHRQGPLGLCDSTVK